MQPLTEKQQAMRQRQPRQTHGAKAKVPSPETLDQACRRFAIYNYYRQHGLDRTIQHFKLDPLKFGLWESRGFPLAPST